MSIVSKYLKKLTDLTTEQYKYIYRGQSDEKWKIVSTYYRRFNPKNPKNPINPTDEEYKNYHRELLDDAKSSRYHVKKDLENLKDIELLFELQHYGAATGLIDFSKDFLVAMWFACEDSKKSGKIFLLDISNIDKIDGLSKDEKLFDKSTKKLLYLDIPFNINDRISVQKGVSILSNQEISQVESLVIKKGHKQKLLQELQEIFNIGEKNLFPDKYGFSQANSVSRLIGKKPYGEYFSEGNNLYRKGHYQEAIDAYKKAIKIKPDFHGAYNNMGLVYDNLEQYPKAISAYKKAISAHKKAIKIKDDFHIAYNNMGVVYNKLEQYQEAINTYKKAIEIKDDYYNAYYNMGNTYNKLEKYQKAINAYQKAIKIKDDYHEAHFNMGNVYDNLEQYQEAINAYEKAIEIKPSLIDITKKQGWSKVERWVNNLADSPTKQHNLLILRKLKGDG